MNVQPRKTAVRSRRIHSLTASISDAERQQVTAIAVGVISDAASVQRALSVVINAVAAGTLDPARAKVLLYGLQIASTNAHRLATSAKKEEAALPVEQMVADATTAIETTITPLPSQICHPERTLSEQRESKGESKDLHSCKQAIVHNEAANENEGESVQITTEVPAQPDVCTEQGFPPAYLSTAPGYSSGNRERLLSFKARSQGAIA